MKTVLKSLNGNVIIVDSDYNKEDYKDYTVIFEGESSKAFEIFFYYETPTLTKF